MGNWNFDDIENSLVSDAEKRITRGYQKKGMTGDGSLAANNLAGTEPARDLSPVIPGTPAPARGQSLGSVPMPTDSPQAAEPVTPIGLKGPDTKGVQTYLPLKDYMRLMQQKTLRKQNIAQIAGEAIIDWLDRQEQK